MRVVINTPSGNIGRRLASQLLERGVEVVGISRNPEKIRDLVDRGLKVVEGSADDAAVIARAFEGADAVFWLTPPTMRPDFIDWAAETGRKAAAIAKEKGVRRAVVLSSVGAQAGRGIGPVSPMLEVEGAFNAAIADVTVLRPGFFMENMFNNLQTIAKAGAIFQAAPADYRVPMVATADIGDKAADVLLDAAWSGHRIVGVHGPADLSFSEAAAVVGEALGRPVRYVQISLEEAHKGMLGAGMPPFAADLYLDMYRALGEGRMRPAEPRSPETTTPTTLAQFTAEVLRPAVEQAAAS